MSNPYHIATLGNADSVYADSTSATLSNFTLSGDRRKLVAFASRPFEGDYPTSMTAGGVAMNIIDSYTSGGVVSGRTFYLDESELPANGDVNIVATYSTTNDIVLSAVLLNGMREGLPSVSVIDGSSVGAQFFNFDIGTKKNYSAVVGFAAKRFNEDFTYTGSLSEVSEIINANAVGHALWYFSEQKGDHINFDATWSTTRDWVASVMAFDIADALPDAPVIIPNAKTRIKQPLQITEFNKFNKFGRYATAAIVPGWDYRDEIRVLGMPNPLERVDAGSGAIIERHKIDSYFGSPVRYWNIQQVGSAIGTYYKEFLSNNTGPKLGSSFTAIVIIKPIGDGQLGTSDPRYYSKDLGFNTDDHDLMLGSAANTGQVARTRVRIGSNTVTVFNGVGENIQNDAWNLIACTVENNTVNVHHFREDGTYYSNVNTGTGVYNPRSSGTYQGLWNTVGDPAEDSNFYNGGILGAFFFDGILLNEGQFRDFFYNPWQIFESQPIITGQSVNRRVVMF